MHVEGASKASANLLKFQAHHIVKKLPGNLAQMERNQALKFLGDLLALEKRGMNPSFGPRRQVMDAINEQLVKMGVKHAMMTGVVMEEDPDIEDKVTRIAL